MDWLQHQHGGRALPSQLAGEALTETIKMTTSTGARLPNQTGARVLWRSLVVSSTPLPARRWRHPDHGAMLGGRLAVLAAWLVTHLGDGSGSLDGGR